MAVIKCKMCGGDLDITEGLSVCECEYCGTKQTVPSADNEKKLTLFARANRLRLANEFDKAAGVYESIVADFPEEAEAYWGLVLCKYGIEYVDDPATGKKIPTCHRSSFDSVLEDTDFDQACENADAIARRQYREEAKQIEDIRRGIIEISGREEPYDIFICYKESDDSGDRTVDSVIAQDVYDALTAKGYRVFFSRISLEDKLGAEYEPYIFAALNSAKVMLAFGTDYEYYNAVWVKNEWSRFLKQMEKDKTKHLIPCYKNLDPYDMPKEFQRLQGQDMGKVGAVQDLLRGIEKILPREQNAAQPAGQAIQQVVQSGGPNAAALYDRGYMALEDGEWDKAKDYFDQVLNMDSRCADAYLGLVLAERNLCGEEMIAGLKDDTQIDAIISNVDYSKFQRFATEERNNAIEALLTQARIAIMEERRREEEEKRQKREAYVEWQRQKRVKLASIIEKFQSCQGFISVGRAHTVGLRIDGTVLAVGDNTDGQCNVNDWYDIVSISAGLEHTVGLRADGTVLAVGDNTYGQCMTSDWRNIVSIAAGAFHTIGLKLDGTLISAGRDFGGQCEISDWTDVVAITTGTTLTVGLRSDGTVIATGSNSEGQCDISDWTDIVAIAVGSVRTVGLRSDGTVIATGLNSEGQSDINDWTDIVAVAVSASRIVGLRTNGTVLASGINSKGQCDVSGWKLFNSIDTLEQERRGMAARAEAERKEAAVRAEAERMQRIAEMTAEQNTLRTELANLKGLFSGKRRREIEARLAQIEKDLGELEQ